MNGDDRSEVPSWRDPEFTPLPGAADKGRPGARPAGYASLNARGWIPWLLLAVLFLGLSSDPLVGPLIVGAVKLAALTVGIVAAAMLLGLIGSGLFAVGDRILAGLRGANHWPDE